MNKEFLFKLLNTSSPSGHEYNLQKVVLQEMTSYVDKNIKDNTGNLINVINQKSNYKVLMCGHADEISLMVTKILKNGMIKAVANGGVNAAMYHGSRVKIIHGDKEIKGVINVNDSCKDKVTLNDLTIDIGTFSEAETKKYVSLGDYVVIDVEPQVLLNDFVVSKALDDKIGVYIINEALIRAKQLGAKVGVYAASTVGEETTMRGSYWASSKIKPDFAIIVDVTFATDYPGAVTCDMDVSLGQGGVLCLSTIVHPKLNELFKNVAEKLNYKIQYEAAPRRTGTDGDTVIKTAEGVPVVLVSIPLRNMHSPVEMVSLKDVNEIIELIAHVLVEIDDGLDLSLF